MGKGEKLSKKEKGFVQDYVETGNATLSAKRNFDTATDNSAGVMGNKQLRKVKIQKAIMSIAEQIPDSLLVKKHLELLNVPRKMRTYIKGDLTNEIEELDSNAVSKGLDMAYKLKSSYAPEKMNLSGSISISSLFDKAQEDDNK